VKIIMNRTIYFLVLFFVAAFAASNPPSPDSPRPPTEVPQHKGFQVGDIVGVRTKAYETVTPVGHFISLVPRISIKLISIAGIW
jgi:hypothetical protein